MLAKRKGETGETVSEPIKGQLGPQPPAQECPQCKPHEGKRPMLIVTEDVIEQSDGKHRTWMFTCPNAGCGYSRKDGILRRAVLEKEKREETP